MDAVTVVRSYDTLDAAAIEWCARWVRLRVECARRRPAVVFDIDQTLLTREREPNEAVCALYDACRSAGAVVFVVTARSSAGRDVAERDLEEAGVRGYRKLFMHSATRRCANSEDAGREKARARARIEDEHGMDVCLNVGDAWHDHVMPPKSAATARLGHDRVHVFLTPDGCAHLKLQG